MSKTTHPLQWPQGWKRTKQPGKSQFRATLSAALNNVNKSIEFFAKDSRHKIDDLVISSNVTLGSMNPDDSGMALYFNWNGIATCIAVDRYKKVEENLQAIHHCIEAKRTKLRHGGINLVEAAFRGYAGLPPPSAAGGSKPWGVVLGVSNDASHTDIRARYKRLLNTYHPDKPTGDRVKFDEVQQAWKEYENKYYFYVDGLGFIG